MAAGFDAEYVSRAGRKVKPTEKVRKLMAGNLSRSLGEQIANLVQLEGHIRQLMTQGMPAHQISKQYDEWMAKHDDVVAVEDQLRTMLDEESLEEHDDLYQSDSNLFNKFRMDFYRYLCSCPVTKSTPRKVTSLVDLKRKTQSLENDIKEIGNELSVTMSKVNLKPSTPPNPIQEKGDAARSKISQKASKTDSPGQPTSDTAVAILRLAQVLEARLGKEKKIVPEPEVYSGDLMEFPQWWGSFIHFVESKADTPQECLFLLGKYTTGNVKDCIRNYLFLHYDPTAYTKAKDTVLQRYGDKVKIAAAFKSKLAKWSPMKQGESINLQRYADLLWQCHAAMSTMSNLASLNTQDEGVKMAAKLPQGMGERWNRKVDRWMYPSPEEGEDESWLPQYEYPPFSEFCKFVSAEARVANGPCARGAKSDDSPSHKGKKATALSTSTTGGQKSKAKGNSAPPVYRCTSCKKSHHISTCEEFLKNSAEFKKNFARENSLCFGCLKKGHSYRDCRTKDASLLKEPNQKSTTMATETTAGEQATQVTAMNTEVVQSASRQYYSMVVPVWVYHHNDIHNRVKTYAIIDSQSNNCFMSDDLQSRLNVNAVDVKLELTTMGSKCEIGSKAVSGLNVQGIHETNEVELPICYTRHSIPADRESIPRKEVVGRWEHLEDVARVLDPYDADMEVGMLIGYNVPRALAISEHVHRGEDLPFAHRTALGWTVMGKIDEGQGGGGCFCNRTIAREITAKEMCRAFDVEFKFEDEDAPKRSYDDNCFDEMMTRGIKQCDDGHFELPLPLRERPLCLPDTRRIAAAQLIRLTRKFRTDAKLHENYKSFIDNLVASGHAEYVTAAYGELREKCWYHPHLGVYHPRKPDALRVVFNISMEVRGRSLNSMLMAGPDRINNLVGVLCRFRREKIAVVCDIKGMFHQVFVKPDDCDYLRFLWVDGGDPDGEIVEMRMLVHLFGATSSPACANKALKATADRYEDEFGKEAADFIRDNFYVDDGLGSVPDVESGLELVNASHGMCKAGGFHLHKFLSSNAELLQKIPRELCATSIQNLEFSVQELPTECTLGMEWSGERDCFLFKIKLVVKAATRRGMLSSLSSVYDPLGVISPVMLPGRNMLQEICQKDFSWDEELPDEMVTKWNQWFSQLSNLERLEVPRCMRATCELPLASTTMHVFCDASTLGLGVCAYLHLRDENGNHDVSLLTAKAKVLPSKTTTIPRLELQSAVLAVKMSKFLEKELRYPHLEIKYYTDSKISLGYINNVTKRYHVFVANRIQYIRDATDVSQWQHVSSGENPADIASRGVTAEELTDSQLWWKGPDLITAAANSEEGNFEVPDDDPEIKKKATVFASKAKAEWRSPIVEAVSKVSRWYNAITIAAIWRRYADNLRSRLSSQSSRKYVGFESIDVEERRKAEALIISQLQKQEFPYEYDKLTKCVGYPKERGDIIQRNVLLRRESNLYKLDVYLDEESTIRVGGRLRRSTLARDQKHPRVIPRDGQITEMIVRYYHDECRHSGRGMTLNNTRAGGYWIINVRGAVDLCIRRCVICKQLRGKPVVQVMSDLPEDRLEPAPPFTYCAVDFFGPYYVKEGRSVKKRWACMFVDQVSRAVHVEPAHSLSTDSFLHAYRRFVSRRGEIRQLRCDRGTNFVGARNELQAEMKEMDQQRVEHELAKRGCDFVKFKFNVPRASHMGGAWERMVRSIRNALAHILSQHGDQLNDEMLHTFLTEAESVVNSRPLTCVESSDVEHPTPISPAQLLTLKTTTVQPLPGNFVHQDLYSQKRWKRVQYLADLFWRRWTAEYLPTLQSRSKWNDEHENLKEGDLVLLIEDNIPRGSWPKGRIVETDRSIDKLVRKVKVKTITGQYERPISKLIFLYRKGD